MEASALSQSALPSSSASPLSPVPFSRSLPKYLGFYGKHRKQAELQILNREIGFLEEELQSLQGLQLASRCCKEVDEFVDTKPDPLTPLSRKIDTSFYIWKWLCGVSKLSLRSAIFKNGIWSAKSCSSMTWICCFNSPNSERKRSRCTCGSSGKWRCFCHHCCVRKSSSRQCCILPSLSCRHCTCGCLRCFPSCKKVCNCSNCTRNCCLPCCTCICS